MKLYAYWRSSASWRVRIGLELKGLDYEYVPVNLLHGDQKSTGHRGLNPMAQVPVLEWEQDGQTLRMTQSMAILDLLDRSYPDATPLWPSDPFLRAKAFQLAEIVNAGIQPLQNLTVLGAIAELGGDKKQWGHDVIAQGLAAMQAAAAPTAGAYLVGNDVSIADILLIPQLYNARRFGVDLEPLGLLTAVEERCARRPAFDAAHPDNQPDAPRE